VPELFFDSTCIHLGRRTSIKRQHRWKQDFPGVRADSLVDNQLSTINLEQTSMRFMPLSAHRGLF
jgi:hypothetical protein